MSLFIEISLALMLAAIISFLVANLKQPLLIGYILSGVLLGPMFLDVMQSMETIELFSKLGIAILLFIVGLGLNPQTIKEVGKVSFLTGVGQVLFTSLIGFGIALSVGIEPLAALYVAIGLTFSSTIIILKLLSDKGDMYALYGRIAIGFLLVQDIIATLILLVFSVMSGDGASGVQLALEVLTKGLVVAGFLYVIDRYVVEWLTREAAEKKELLYLFALTWGLVFASLFEWMGFSVEIGALIGGVLLARTPYALEIGARLQPLRDFFIVLFFILLGAQMDLATAVSQLPLAILLSAFVLVGNPVIVVVLMNLLGYGRRIGYQAGLTVAQISEFSLILAALGLQLGHIDQAIVSLITMVGLITITASTYLILYADSIYPRVDWLLKRLELTKQTKSSSKSVRKREVYVIGYHRVGQEVVEVLRGGALSYAVIDVNPQLVEKMQEKRIPHIYGDASDPEFLSEIDFTKTELVISTMPKLDQNLLILAAVREDNPVCGVITLAQDAQEALRLYQAGALYVMVPHYSAAKNLVRLLKQYGAEKRGYKKLRKSQQEHLEYKLALL